MTIQNFFSQLNNSGIPPLTFFTGVPDSQLRPLCDYLMDVYGISKNHIIAANEGNCTAMAAGYHLSTGKIPVVYMQNSGIGNIINPVTSLLNEKVYGIPCIFIVGWRGEPGRHDEPQHIFQGETTVNLLEEVGISTFILSKETKPEEIEAFMCGHKQKETFKQGKSIAFIIKKGGLEYETKVKYTNKYKMNREAILEEIVKTTGEDIIISSTGKISRELFEIRERNGQEHKYDFLTVGSMGHSSSIAAGIAAQKPDTKVWCIEGDGAVIMHMGAMAVTGAQKLSNMIHIVLNNSAHETVGGMPTVAGKMDWVKIAEGCGYPKCFSADNEEELKTALKQAKDSGELTFIEVKCSLGSREDLGRPTTTAQENKINFMEYLQHKD